MRNMVKIDADDLITIAQAAQERGTSREAIYYLIRQGKFSVTEIAGKQFLSRREVASFIPDKGGRPPKTAKVEQKKSSKK